MSNSSSILDRILAYQDKLDLSRKALEEFKEDLKFYSPGSEEFIEGLELIYSSMYILAERYTVVALSKAKRGIVGRSYIDN